MGTSLSAPGDSAIPGSGSASIVSKTLTIFSPLAPLSNERGALTVLSQTRTPVGLSFHFLYPWAFYRHGVSHDSVPTSLIAWHLTNVSSVELSLLTGIDFETI